tara:strand:+ start:147 stop:500 length:354 start_codon:yes stop_codon:yes gene_type:complete
MLKLLENKKKQIESLSFHEVDRLKRKYPNKIAILVTTTDNIKIDRQKYLVEKSTKFAELLLVFRRRIEDLKATESLYMFVGEDPTLVPLHKEIVEIFDELNTCGYIKIKLAKENTFG